MTPVPLTTQALDYDRMGRVQSQRQTVGTTTRTLGFSFNLLGQLQSETYPSGRVVSTSYDAAARLTGVSDAGHTAELLRCLRSSCGRLREWSMEARLHLSRRALVSDG